MFFIVLCIAAAVVFVCYGIRFRARALDNIEYRVGTNVNEVFEGDEFFMYESIANAKSMALPNIRADLILPDGLDFCLYDKTPDGRVMTLDRHSVESVFVLKPASRVRRRWRVKAGRRGIYHLGQARISVTDLFGIWHMSSFTEADTSPETSVTVLPLPIDIEEYFAPASDESGDADSRHAMVPDPILIKGSREYMQGDPINRINWKSSARMHRPMVNIDEYTEKNAFDIIFNIQSRGRENEGDVPESADSVELGISVCAAVFDRACSRDIPVRLICNTTHSDSDDRYFVSDHFVGNGDGIAALRMLAGIEMRISCRLEEMLDSLIDRAEQTPMAKNLVFVTSYIDEAIVDYIHAMQAMDVEVTVYATTGMRTMTQLPEDINIYYKTYR